MKATAVARSELIEHQVAPRIEAARRGEDEVEQRRGAVEAARRHEPKRERKARLAYEKRGLEEARARLVAARKERDDAIAACVTAAPLIEVVYGVESIIDGVRRDWRIGRETGSGDATAASLDDLRDVLLARWFPGVDLPAVIARLLLEEEPPEERPHSLPRPRMDPRLGYAALDEEEELRVLVAHHMAASPALAELRRTFGNEATVRASIEKRLADLEEKVSFLDELLPGENSIAERERNAQRAELEAQRRRELAALEAVHHAVAQAVIRAHPVAWLVLTTGAAAAAFRAVRTRHEVTLGVAGAVEVASAAGRAVALAALVEMRRACDAAFDGLGAAMFRRTRPPEPAQPDAGPYRARGFVPKPHEPFEKGRSPVARAFAAQLEMTLLRGELAWAVAVSMAAGILELAMARASSETPWFVRMVAGANVTREQPEASLAQRVETLSDIVAVHATRSLQTVDACAASHPLLRIGRAIAATHVAVNAVRHSPFPHECRAVGVEDAQMSLTHAVNLLSRHFGVTTDRPKLVQRICARLEAADRTFIQSVTHPRTTAELTELFASTLQATEFVDLVRAYERHWTLATGAEHRARHAGAGASLFDHLSVSTVAPAVRAQRQARRKAWAHHREAVACYARARTLLVGALAYHPPSALAFQGVEVGDDINRIRATREYQGNAYHCVITGWTQAKASLQAWTRAVVGMLGPLPCAGDLLDEWVNAELD